MSCNYAEGLSNYENKGILGIPEVFDSEEKINEKCEILVNMIKSSKHIVFHTGAGISTKAGIPDFRGPNGVWTLEKKGERPKTDISFEDAKPTLTHMSLKALVDANIVQYIVSQNIDGLHLKSGLERKYLSEVHGNMFVEQCNKCRRQYVRNLPTPTVGKKLTGGICKGGQGSRSCRGGYLIDVVLDWEHDLPEKDLDLALMHSTIADLNICLGTTLQILPSGNLPLKNKKYDGKVVICNLQPTKHDKKADLVISSFVDEIMSKVMKKLNIPIPEYSTETDPTKLPLIIENFEWTLLPEYLKEIEILFNTKTKVKPKKRKLLDEKREDVIKLETIKIEKNELKTEN